jgi:hypothetical protein
MPQYNLERLLYDVSMQPELRARFDADPTLLLHEYRVPDDVAELLHQRRFDELLALGVHPIVLRNVFRVL